MDNLWISSTRKQNAQVKKTGPWDSGAIDSIQNVKEHITTCSAMFFDVKILLVRFRLKCKFTDMTVDFYTHCSIDIHLSIIHTIE